MPELTPPLLDRTCTHYLLLYNYPFSSANPSLTSRQDHKGLSEKLLKNPCAWTWLTLEQICSGS